VCAQDDEDLDGEMPEGVPVRRSEGADLQALLDEAGVFMLL